MLPNNLTPETPLVFRYVGHTPSLKNRRRPVREKGKLTLKKNFEVMQFLERAKRAMTQQWKDTGYDVIPPPTRVGLFVEVVFYRANPALLPASDGDNAYTTIQETLKKLVVKDDNQVGIGTFEVSYTSRPELEHAVAYMWIIDEYERPRVSMARFIAHQETNRVSVVDALHIPSLIENALKEYEKPHAKF